MKKTPPQTVSLIRNLTAQGISVTEIHNRTGLSHVAIRTYTLDLRGGTKLNTCRCGAIIKKTAKCCRERNHKDAARRSKAHLEGRRKPSESMASPWKESNTHMTYRQYVSSGVWKCDKSPSGAHIYELSASDTGACVYCGNSHASRDIVVPETVAELEYAGATL